MKRTGKRIDLHMHTTVSDGTDPPEEILTRVRELGLEVFSVTDHDAIQAGKRIPPLLEKNDPLFITGVEFSCRDGHGKYHILGYGYDPDAAAIRAITEKGHAARMKKTQARLSFLKEQFGFVFTEEEVAGLFANENPGKPHIANLMVSRGYAPDKNEAIHRYINQKHFPDIYLHPEDAVRAIEDSGGIPVLAHPSYGSGDELIVGREMRERLQRLIAKGLRGVEAYYSGFTPELQAEMLAFAAEFDLYVTAGSDYHGKNKLIELGDNNLSSTEDAAEGLHRFLEDVRTISPAEQKTEEEGRHETASAGA